MAIDRRESGPYQGKTPLVSCKGVRSRLQPNETNTFKSSPLFSSVRSYPMSNQVNRDASENIIPCFMYAVSAIRAPQPPYAVDRYTASYSNASGTYTSVLHYVCPALKQSA